MIFLNSISEHITSWIKIFQWFSVLLEWSLLNITYKVLQHLASTSITSLTITLFHVLFIPDLQACQEPHHLHLFNLSSSLLHTHSACKALPSSPYPCLVNYYSDKTLLSQRSLYMHHWPGQVSTISSQSIINGIDHCSNFPFIYVVIVPPSYPGYIKDGRYLAHHCIPKSRPQ